MNEVKNMTKEELIDVLEEKGICVVLDNNLDDYIDYLMTIWRKSPYFSRGMDSPK